ncbi:hypothetical protein EJB05_57236, partial [Eragrostis curvula]
MGIAVLAPVAAAYSCSSSSSSLAPPPQRRAPSRAHVAAAGMSSRASSFVAGGGGLALTAALVAARPRRAGAGGGGALGCKCLFGLGVPELVVIAGVAALVFGPKQLPEVGRNIGKTVKSFQQVGISHTTLDCVVEILPDNSLGIALLELTVAAKEFETELKKEPGEGGDQPPPTTPTAVSDGEEGKKGLETSSTKEST